MAGTGAAASSSARPSPFHVFDSRGPLSGGAEAAPPLKAKAKAGAVPKTDPFSSSRAKPNPERAERAKPNPPRKAGIGNLLVLKDFPFTLLQQTTRGAKARQFITQLNETLSRHVGTSFRLALIGNEDEAWEFRKLFGLAPQGFLIGSRPAAVCSKVRFVPFNPVAPTLLQKGLQRILALSGQCLSAGMLGHLAQTGDIRQAVHNLQFYSTSPVVVSGVVGGAAAAPKTAKPKKRGRKKLLPERQNSDGAASPATATLQGTGGGVLASSSFSGGTTANQVDENLRQQKIDQLQLFHALGRVLYNKRLLPRADKAVLLAEYRTWRDENSAHFWQQWREGCAASSNRVVSCRSGGGDGEKPVARENTRSRILSDIPEEPSSSDNVASLSPPPRGTKRRRVDGHPATVPVTTGFTPANCSLHPASSAPANCPLPPSRPSDSFDVFDLPRPRPGLPLVSDKDPRQLTPHESNPRAVRPDSYFDVAELVEIQDPNTFTDLLFTNAPLFMGSLAEYADHMDALFNLVWRSSPFDDGGTGFSGSEGGKARRGLGFVSVDTAELCARSYLDKNNSPRKPTTGAHTFNSSAGGSSMFAFRRSRRVDVSRALERAALCRGLYEVSPVFSVGGLSTVMTDYGSVEFCESVNRIATLTQGMVPKLADTSLMRIKEQTERFVEVLRLDEFGFDPREAQQCGVSGVVGGGKMGFHMESDVGDRHNLLDDIVDSD